MKLEILFLKSATVLLGLAVLSFFLIVIPDETDMSKVGVLLPFLISMYVSTIPFFFALFHTFKLLGYIDSKKAFSKLSIKALQYIKYSAVVFSAIYFIQLPLLYLIAQEDDAPGVAVLGLIVTLLPISISIFTSLLQKVIQNQIGKKD
ncbi:MAG: DUF2975 domain-containing protein [Candidatus Dojkabacteria bacterium]|jgi:hypothetical protein|nr:DUF2975 domain-containing protein [Candidatus Dojkabacteria bacterium]